MQVRLIVRAVKNRAYHVSGVRTQGKGSINCYLVSLRHGSSKFATCQSCNWPVTRYRDCYWSWLVLVTARSIPEFHWIQQCTLSRETQKDDHCLLRSPWLVSRRWTLCLATLFLEVYPEKCDARRARQTCEAWLGKTKNQKVLWASSGGRVVSRIWSRRLPDYQAATRNTGWILKFWSSETPFPAFWEKK